MSAREYEKTVYQATGFPDPEEADEERYHHLGDWDIHETSLAIDAVVNRRLTRIRNVLRQATPLPHEAKSLIEEQDFLSYGEYLEAVRRISEIKQTLTRIDNLARKQTYNKSFHSNKPHFYQTITPPNPKETSLAREFDVNRFTPDRAGHLAYLQTFAPPLASFFFRRLPALIPEDVRTMHSYLTGSSGSGKSELMKVLIHSYAKQENPPCIVVLDPHGKFADEVAGQKEIIEADRLIYINPAMSSTFTPTLNPFELDAPKAAGTVADQLMGVFDELFRGAKNAGLTGNMSALLIPCMTALLRMPDTDLLTLQALLGSGPKDALFQAALAHMKPQQQDFISKEWEKKRYETTKEAVIAKIQTLMNSEHFLNFLCGPSTIDLEEAVKQRKTICFSLQKGEISRDTVSAMGAFVMATLQGFVLRKYKTRKHDMIPIHVFVDECHNFLSPTVTEILEEARKFGLHLTLAQQYAGQKMDTELSKTVLGNSALKIAGFNDEKSTHREMARLMDLDETQMVRLKKRCFFVKAGDKAAVKLYPPSNLADRKNCVPYERWKVELAKQKETYYRPIKDRPSLHLEFDTKEDATPRAGPPKPKQNFV